jgi:hypothetical protein
MTTGIMIFIFALMSFALVTAVYSAIFRLIRRGRQRRWTHRKADQQDDLDKREAPEYMDVFPSERNST